MDRKRANIEPEIIDALRQQVENFANRRMVTPSDFEFLAQAIQSSIQRPVSPTTLKRVWGYIRDTGTDYSPGRYTLCALAGFIGFRDIEDFEYHLSENSIPQSNHYFGMTIGSADIPEGAIIEIKWQPNRLVHLRHQSANNYKVILAENSKLCVGDEVDCHSFTQNAPLYIARVIRGDAPPTTYVAGSRSGVHYRILPSSEQKD